MITDLELVCKGNDCLNYKLDGVDQGISFDEFSKYWTYASEDDLEGAHVEMIDNKLLGFFLTANSQGGVIFIWDAEKRRFEHISDGSYCVALCLTDDKIFCLQDVTNFVTPSHFVLSMVNRGVVDINNAGSVIEFSSDASSSMFDGDFENIKLYIKDGVLNVSINEKNYPIQF